MYSHRRYNTGMSIDWDKLGKRRKAKRAEACGVVSGSFLDVTLKASVGLDIAERMKTITETFRTMTAESYRPFLDVIVNPPEELISLYKDIKLVEDPKLDPSTVIVKSRGYSVGKIINLGDPDEE